MIMTEKLDHAIVAHSKWKLRLREAIDTGKSSWQVQEVRHDRGCEFGQWLAALPLTQKFAAHAEKVRSLHAEFHVLAAEVLETALVGRKVEASALMALGSRFSVVSSDLVMAIIAWQEDLAKGPGAELA